jgi:hypothetical protein
MGWTVRSVPGTHGYDLLVNDETRVTLRVAFPSMRKHRVTAGGRTYLYRYRTWHFNFHQHGKLSSQYTDCFVCIAVNPRDPSSEDVFVIPWDEVSGKTFSLHCGRTAYSGHYAPFRSAWDLIGSRRALRRVA